MSRTEKAMWISAIMLGFSIGLIGGSEVLKRQWARKVGTS